MDAEINLVEVYGSTVDISEVGNEVYNNCNNCRVIVSKLCIVMYCKSVLINKLLYLKKKKKKKNCRVVEYFVVVFCILQYTS